MSREKMQKQLAATDFGSTPRAHQIMRWQGKICAWKDIKPEWAEQMEGLVYGYVEQARRASVADLGIRKRFKLFAALALPACRS